MKTQVYKKNCLLIYHPSSIHVHIFILLYQPVTTCLWSSIIIKSLESRTNENQLEVTKRQFTALVTWLLHEDFVDLESANH